ncbi:MAG TPA: HAD-IA family hydrolase [Caulobacteraceae bacterium]|nr:HAD-IA family hydrolase [Caulobacteraceae bacterium]
MAASFDALVFDLGGVIVAHDNAVMVERIASKTRATPRDVSRLIRRKDWGSGLPIADLHAELRDELGYDAGWDQFAADWCCHFTVDPSMLAFVRQLGARNRVMLFSNTNQVHWDYLVAETGGALGELEAYLSHEIRLSKPAVESFHRVAKDAGIDPARSIFFDDVAANVEGARLAGFQAEVFVDQASLTALLREKGVPLA